MMNIYHEDLNDHYRNPRNRGVLKNPDFSSGRYNPSCGDSIAMQGKVADDTIVAIAFTGQGCVISQAAASLLTEYALEKKTSDVLQLDAETMRGLVGIALGPTRLKCAVLPLEALQGGLNEVT